MVLGITGQALTGRAYVQAQKFGADMLIPAEVRTARTAPPATDVSRSISPAAIAGARAFDRHRQRGMATAARR